jgi:hypothetical protein
MPHTSYTPGQLPARPEGPRGYFVTGAWARSPGRTSLWVFLCDSVDEELCYRAAAEHLRQRPQDLIHIGSVTEPPEPRALSTPAGRPSMKASHRTWVHTGGEWELVAEGPAEYCWAAANRRRRNGTAALLVAPIDQWPDPGLPPDLIVECGTDS